MSSAHYPQSNGKAECVVKASMKLVHGNTDSHSTLNMDKYLQAILTSVNKDRLGFKLNYKVPVQAQVEPTFFQFRSSLCLVLVW